MAAAEKSSLRYASESNLPMTTFEAALSFKYYCHEGR